MRKIFNYQFYLITSIAVFCNAAYCIGQNTDTKDELKDFSWVIGTWQMQMKNGSLYENWMAINDSTFQSNAFKVKNSGDTIMMESVKIEYKNKSYYYTSTVPDQNNQQPVSFKITSFTKSGFIAENPVHDFPQRISYELQNDGQLHAFIDGKDKGQYKKSEFTYRRVESNSYNPNRSSALKLFEAFNKHDWKSFAECYAADADFLDPSYGKDYVKQTHQQLIDKYAGFQETMPDIRDNIVELYDAGDRIIIEFISSGTLPDGKKWKLPICTVLTYKNGKIIRDATYFDDEK